MESLSDLLLSDSLSGGGGWETAFRAPSMGLLRRREKEKEKKRPSSNDQSEEEGGVAAFSLSHFSAERGVVKGEKERERRGKKGEKAKQKQFGEEDDDEKEEEEEDENETGKDSDETETEPPALSLTALLLPTKPPSRKRETERNGFGRRRFVPFSTEKKKAAATPFREEKGEEERKEREEEERSRRTTVNKAKERKTERGSARFSARESESEELLKLKLEKTSPLLPNLFVNARLQYESTAAYEERLVNRRSASVVAASKYSVVSLRSSNSLSERAPLFSSSSAVVVPREQRQPAVAPFERDRDGKESSLQSVESDSSFFEASRCPKRRFVLPFSSVSDRKDNGSISSGGCFSLSNAKRSDEEEDEVTPRTERRRPSLSSLLARRDDEERVVTVRHRSRLPNAKERRCLRLCPDRHSDGAVNAELQSSRDEIGRMIDRIKSWSVEADRIAEELRRSSGELTAKA